MPTGELKQKNLHWTDNAYRVYKDRKKLLLQSKIEKQINNCLAYLCTGCINSNLTIYAYAS